MRGHWIVVGLGLSGYWAARLVVERENPASLTICEGRPDPKKKEMAKEIGALCTNGGCGFELLWQPKPERWEDADKIVISPGVPHDLPWLEDARRAGIEVMGEMELAFRHTTTPVVAITGTNGKTTTTALLAHMLNSTGVTAWAGGNIGDPLSHLVLSGEDPDWVVLEVSSFQLETVKAFHPRVAMLLNLAEDHLDRYPSMGEYAGAKAKILLNLDEGDTVVANGHDKAVIGMLKTNPKPRTLTFGGGGAEKTNLTVRSGALVMDGEKLCSIESLGPQAQANLPNVMAALLGAHAVGAPLVEAVKAIGDFEWQPHRTQVVAKRGGVTFVDDSKATNPSAVAHALMAVDGKVILLMGGRNKGFRFGSLTPLLRRRTKEVLLFGESAVEIAGDLERSGAKVSIYGPMEDAVKAAVQRAEPGDTVLLSPGCASFDQFESYAHRGKVFASLVGGEG